MTRSSDRTLIQLLNHGDPVTPAELRELTLRHILADPNDTSITTTIKSLFDAYLACKAATSPHPPLGDGHGSNCIEYDTALTLYHKHFKESLDHPPTPRRELVDSGDYWPAALPRFHLHYPKDIIIETAVAIALRKSSS